MPQLLGAAGYRTAYVSAQHFGFNDFGSYVAVAGIDHMLSAADLDPKPDVWLGAPDERAMDATLKYAAGLFTNSATAR